MNKINIKALISTIIVGILFPLFAYLIVVNYIAFIIFITIFSVIALIVIFYGLYIFFDECF